MQSFSTTLHPPLHFHSEDWILKELWTCTDPTWTLSLSLAKDINLKSQMLDQHMYHSFDCLQNGFQHFVRLADHLV